MRLAGAEGNALFTLAVELRAVRLTPASRASIGRLRTLCAVADLGRLSPKPGSHVQALQQGRLQLELNAGFRTALPDELHGNSLPSGEKLQLKPQGQRCIACKPYARAPGAKVSDDAALHPEIAVQPSPLMCGRSLNSAALTI